MIAKSVILFATIGAVLAQDTTTSEPPAAPTTTPAGPPPNFTPLASKHFEYTALPYQADTDVGGERGAQFGYNICNSTTENQDSRCQTAIINSIDDWCIWGPPDADSLIGDTEGEAVAWCTKGGHGTRRIPEGAITGVQFVQTPDYIQISGTINQRLINIDKDDSGGEMDPHGADQRGNPLGGLVFTNNFPASAGDANKYIQVVEWHNFMGEDMFCLKACDPSRPNAARYCEHIFDRIGCWYNAPAPYVEGVFESCQGDSQMFPGVYVGANGQTSTYTQPPESLGPIQTMPYQPVQPASSSCTTFQSAQLYSGAPSATISVPRPSNTRTTTRSASTARPSSTSSTASAGEKLSNSVAVLLFGVVGSICSVLFF